MPRRIALTLAALGAIIGALVVAPTVAAGDPCFHDMTRPAPTTGATVRIAIGECTFSPTVSYVPVGTTVQWTSSTDMQHEVVGANLTWGAHDKLIGKGDSIGWTFDKSGVYPYTCMIHPGMTGAIVVGAAAEGAGAAPAAAVEATPPDAPATTGAATAGIPTTVVAATVGAGAVGVLLGGLFLLRRRESSAG